MTVKEALDIIEAEAQLMKTHDTILGSSIILEAVTYIRGHLRGLGYALAGLISIILLAGCGKAPTAPAQGPITAAPGVSEAVIQRYVAAAPTVAPTPMAEFNCEVYARQQIPWKHDHPSRVFEAAHEALLPPDDPKFDRQRTHGCSVLAVAFAREQKAARKP